MKQEVRCKDAWPGPGCRGRLSQGAAVRVGCEWDQEEGAQVTVPASPSPSLIAGGLPGPGSVSRRQPGTDSFIPEGDLSTVASGCGICWHPRNRGPRGQGNVRYVSCRWGLDSPEVWLSTFLQAEASCGSGTVCVIIILLDPKTVHNYVHVLFKCLGPQV